MSADFRNALIRVADGVHILNPAVGADTMAVLAAKISREPNLVRRWDELVALCPEPWDFQNPPAPVRQFLDKNLAGYNHASIGSMAKAVWLWVMGFGWPGAWLGLDFPLFDGQETSTRAVEADFIPGADGPGSVCRYADRRLQGIHDQWMGLYTEAKARAEKGAWKFDDARVYLPGTTPTSLVFTNDVRAIGRQADLIRGLGEPWAGLAEQIESGLRAAAPATTAAIVGRARQPTGLWRFGLVRAPSGIDQWSVEMGAFVSQHDGAPGSGWTRPVGAVARPDNRSYLDPAWALAPRVKLSFITTVAAARDWHRHRPVMPWRLEAIVDENGDPVFAPWYAEARSAIPTALLRERADAFQRLGGRNGEWAALHALEFGALVRVTAVGTLPSVVYALELRAGAQGANWEYKAQARAGLQQLCDLLPADLVREESIDGVLRRP